MQFFFFFSGFSSLTSCIGLSPVNAREKEMQHTFWPEITVLTQYALPYRMPAALLISFTFCRRDDIMLNYFFSSFLVFSVDGCWFFFLSRLIFVSGCCCCSSAVYILFGNNRVKHFMCGFAKSFIFTFFHSTVFHHIFIFFFVGCVTFSPIPFPFLCYEQIGLHSVLPSNYDSCAHKSGANERSKSLYFY